MRYVFLLLFLVVFSAGCASTAQTASDPALTVKADGVVLKEGVDYTVDRKKGTISIVNPTLLYAKTRIEIDAEL